MGLDRTNWEKMKEGYFIGLGDHTTCGGQVLTGDDRVTLFGLLHAREGDLVSCGRHGGIYQIVGGISYINSHGKLMAGTLDSYSSCPCQAKLIPSIYTATYESFAPQANRSSAQPAPAPVAERPVVSPQSGFTPANQSATTLFHRLGGQEPGFFVVPKSMTRQALEASLFPVPDPAVMNKFQLLNPHPGDVKAGSMIVLSDPSNFQCSREEALLMDAAAKTHEAIELLSADEADFMAQHREEIENFLARGSTAIGIGEVMFAKHLEDIKTVLHDIELLHQRTFQADGHLHSPAFFAERKRLLAKFNTHLTALTRKGIGFPDHPNLKSALGISSRSLVHHWTKAGAAQQIPGYATHIEGVAKAAKVIKYGGWIGTAVGGGASYMNVQDVCTAGNVGACERVKFTEAGSFFGGIGGGATVSAFLTPAVGSLCVGLGVPTGGLAFLACGVVAVGVGSYAGGVFGEAAGELIGDIIYESIK